MLETVVVLLFPVLLVYAAVRDLTSYEIPNWLSLAIVADFIVGGAVSSLDSIAVAIIVAVGLVGEEVSNTFDAVATELAGPAPAL